MSSDTVGSELELGHNIRSTYSVFTINAPLAVCFATVAIDMRKAELSEHEIFDSDLH